MNKQGLAYTVIFTFVVSFVFVLFLSFANQTTAPMVELNRELARQRSVLVALGIDFDSAEDVQQRFAEIDQVTKDGELLFRAQLPSGDAFAKEFEGAGVWGPIKGVIAVTADFERTLGLEIVEQNDTPGVGGRITEQWFKDQLRGLRIVDGIIRVGSAGTGDDDKENGTIDAITGATGTSARMGRIFRDELTRLGELLNGGAL